MKERVLVERDFPLLSAMLDSVPIRTLLENDPTLKAATAKRWEDIAAANRNCGADAACRSRALRFSPQEIDDVSSQLRRLYEANPAMKSFAHSGLQPASVFSLDPAKPDEERLVESWVATANGVNRMIATYCDGTAPRYGAIDSMTLQPASKGFASLTALIADQLGIAESESATPRTKAHTIFFEPSLRFAIRVMQANDRDEAGRGWPLETGENAAAVAALRTLKWKQYTHSVIVVLGAGSETPGVPLSPRGRERLRPAIEAWRAGIAPFLAVSGGYVHPAQTPFSEALEMKRYLMQVYGIPASAILVDPYARHTTTNIRNVVREIFRYGIPTDKPILIVSDAAHIDGVAGKAFAKRNQEELGYQPVTIGARVSPSSIDVMPREQSMYRDATDPLDP